MSDFLPGDYSVPRPTSRTMKLEQGDNKFRILDKPFLGYVEWVEVQVDGQDARRPIRRAFTDELTADQYANSKHFWMMPVWNYKAKAVQILEITQRTILSTLEDYSKNPDWGSPLEFDMNIKREGEKLETKYTVTPSPKKELPADVADMWKNLSKSIKIENCLSTKENPYGGDIWKEAKTTDSTSVLDIDPNELPFD